MPQKPEAPSQTNDDLTAVDKDSLFIGQEVPVQLIDDDVIRVPTVELTGSLTFPIHGEIEICIFSFMQALRKKEEDANVTNANVSVMNSGWSAGRAYISLPLVNAVLMYYSIVVVLCPAESNRQRNDREVYKNAAMWC